MPFSHFYGNNNNNVGKRLVFHGMIVPGLIFLLLLLIIMVAMINEQFFSIIHLPNPIFISKIYETKMNFTTNSVTTTTTKTQWKNEFIHFFCQPTNKKKTLPSKMFKCSGELFIKYTHIPHI